MGLANVWILISSACYWAWFDAATFRPTLFMPFVGSEQFYAPYFVIAMTSGAIVLIVAAIAEKHITPYITLRPYGLVAVAVATLASLVTMLGAARLSIQLIGVGAIITGATCSFFLLEWARMYSQQGAKSASVLIASAIAAGVLIDTFIVGLSPLYAAFFTAGLPVLVIGLLFNAYGAINTQSDPITNDVNHTERALEPLTLDGIFSASKHRFFSFSSSLVAAFFIFGFSFGFIQYNSVFSVTELYPLSSDILLLSRGATALLIFLAIYIFPKHIYIVFRIGILIGIGGFVTAPFLSLLSSSSLATGFVVVVGYTTFDVITWTLLAELAFATKVSTISTFGPGRFIVHISVVVGFLAAMVILSNPSTLALREGFSSTVGYFLVIAEVLLLSENSALWMLIRAHTGAESRQIETSGELIGDSSHDSSESFAQSIKARNLTSREADILHYLLLGRSVPRIAQILCISENTVNTHTYHIYQKYGVHTRQELLDHFS
jgi:DNA-binding CsgD family transcriptional regulator